MKCRECNKGLTMGHFTLAHFYPKFFPNPPPMIKGDEICVVYFGDREKRTIYTYCSEKHATAGMKGLPYKLITSETGTNN